MLSQRSTGKESTQSEELLLTPHPHGRRKERSRYDKTAKRFSPIPFMEIGINGRTASSLAIHVAAERRRSWPA
jgi:hypothetical protein